MENKRMENTERTVRAIWVMLEKSIIEHSEGEEKGGMG